jgi:hypothetical protein
MLVIPDTRNASCTVFTACAYFKPTQEIKSSLRRIGEWKIAKSRDLYMMMVGAKSGHFHIDIVSKDVIDPDNLPQTNCKVSEWKALARSLYGKKADASFNATFRLPLSRLPPIIAAQRVAASTETVSIEATGGRFKVSGDAPFKSIRWWIADDDEARIRLHSTNDVDIGDEYLIAAFEPLESGFRAFVADEQNEPDEE